MLMQFSYFTQKQNIVKNAKPGSEEAGARLDELFALPFSHATLRTMSQVNYFSRLHINTQDSSIALHS